MPDAPPFAPPDPPDGRPGGRRTSPLSWAALAVAAPAAAWEAHLGHRYAAFPKHRLNEGDQQGCLLGLLLLVSIPAGLLAGLVALALALAGLALGRRGAVAVLGLLASLAALAAAARLLTLR